MLRTADWQNHPIATKNHIIQNLHLSGQDIIVRHTWNPVLWLTTSIYVGIKILPTGQQYQITGRVDLNLVHYATASIITGDKRLVARQ